MSNHNHGRRIIGVMASAAPLACGGCFFSAPECELCGPVMGEGGAGGAGGTAGAGGAGGAEPVTELFVDPISGSDDAIGTAEAPFRTLGKALSVAERGQTMYLADGTYGPASNGDDFATPVPAGITIAAMAPGAAVLIGSGVETALDFSGDGAASGLRFEGHYSAIRAAAGVLSLSDLHISGTHAAIELSGDAEATLTSSVIADGQRGLHLQESASLTIAGGELYGLGSAPCTGEVVWATQSAHVVLEGVVLRDSFGGLSLRDASTTQIELSLIENVGSPNCGSSSSIMLNEAAEVALTETTVTSAPGWAIYSYGDATHITVTGGTLEGGPHGAISGRGTGAIDGATIWGTSPAFTGISSWFSSLTLRNSEVHGFHTGVHLRSGTALLRDNEISGNVVGVAVDTGASFDMGTSGDLGGNTLQGNDETGLAVYSTGATTFYALGNTWLPFNQGTNAAGQFPILAQAIGPYGAGDATPRNVLVSQAPHPTADQPAQVITQAKFSRQAHFPLALRDPPH
jgi:hypothetical protein